MESIGKVYRIEDKVEKSFNERTHQTTVQQFRHYLHSKGSLQFKQKMWIAY